MSRTSLSIRSAAAVGLLAIAVVAASCSNGNPASSPTTAGGAHGGSASSPSATSGRSSTGAGSSRASGGASGGASSGAQGGSGSTPPSTSSGSSGGQPASGNGSGSSGSSQKQVLTGSTLPSVNVAFTADNSAFQSAAKVVQDALSQLPADATPSSTAQSVQPLVQATRTFQAQLVNLPWPGSTKSDAQALSQDLGQLDAVLSETKSVGGNGLPVGLFRTQVASAVQAVQRSSTSLANGLS